MTARTAVAVIAGSVALYRHLQRTVVGSRPGFHPRQSSLLPPGLMAGIGRVLWCSGNAAEIRSPGLHQYPTAIQQVRSRIGGLDLALDGMRQARFGNLAGLARLPAPIAE